MYVFPVMRWLPRILAIGLALFLSMFALDVFVEYDTFGDIFVALNMHLIPAYIVLFALGIAWYKHLAGGLLFVILGLVSVVFFRTYEDMIVMLLISLPPVVIGILFMVDPQFNYPKSAHYH